MRAPGKRSSRYKCAEGRWSPGGPHGPAGVLTRFREKVIREMDGTGQAVAVMELPEAARLTLSRQGCLLECAFGEGALSLSQEPW